MADLDNITKLKLESILGMISVHSPSFSEPTIGVDPYDKYGDSLSKPRSTDERASGERAVTRGCPCVAGRSGTCDGSKPPNAEGHL